ncbi:helix-turn-helix transcriptional regulator [Aeromonas sp. sif2416]|uniref:helix-turn-helix domain-containing protein n=1 Tax=Aeromonas sp. sif2416 TaxID=2854793 RepID=UPI001C470894|nr:helix-turn-helix transcriptional regulator [Aeromonas sp. sif2416]MBV7439746.1 helix-turn-helix domain-containing protein [Aeromonas sp. sif2416]
MFEQQHSPAYMQFAQQNQRHEIARLQQFVYELENYVATVHQRLVYMGSTLSSSEKVFEFSQLQLTFNQSYQSLIEHQKTLSQMLSLAAPSFEKQISEQCRREIYHLYCAGRYTQVQLAAQYGVSQSAVSKIVNGPAPAPISGVNPQGIAS